LLMLSLDLIWAWSMLVLRPSSVAGSETVWIRLGFFIHFCPRLVYGCYETPQYSAGRDIFHLCLPRPVPARYLQPTSPRYRRRLVFMDQVPYHNDRRRIPSIFCAPRCFFGRQGLHL
jgi:hypothetical protein